MLNENFLWGGATAANQIEGGYQEGNKGDCISDHLTGGSLEINRSFTKNIDPKKIILVMRQLIFIIVIKRISLYLRRWVLKFSECRLRGQEFIQQVKKLNQMKKD